MPNQSPKEEKVAWFQTKVYDFFSRRMLTTILLFAVFYWSRKTQKKKPVSTVSSISFLPKVSYQTLYLATSGFSLSALIGSGGFGSVYKGILDQEANKIVAIKVLDLQHKGASKSFMAECNALRNAKHMNLVKILTCCSSIDSNGNDFKALVFEYMSNGNLEEWLHRDNQSRSLNLLQRLNIAVDVASALCYLLDHCEPQILHCDIKPSNVLLDDDMIARLGDFGLARLISPTTASSGHQSSTVGIKGTIGYAAPEYAVGVQPLNKGMYTAMGYLCCNCSLEEDRPIDEMFVDDCNIQTFVKTGIQGRLMQIVDPTLIATLQETATSATQNKVTAICGYINETEADEDNINNQNVSRMNYLWNCILPVLKIGLACSEDSPRNRISMEEVLRELHRIKKAYNGIDIRRERPRRS